MLTKQFKNLSVGVKMKIKICGITNIEDALCAVENGTDAIGFVFFQQSKRFIHPEEAKKIISQLPPFVFSVGVFVNENPSRVNEIAKELKLNAVQLHGDENIEYINKITFPIIKAFRVDHNFNWEILNDYSTKILLDTFSLTEFGGTGNKFDWQSIPNEIRDKIILSGGIDAESLTIILNEIKPAAIDLSSSLEIEPGKKDHKKIKTFFEKLQSYRSNKC